MVSFINCNNKIIIFKPNIWLSVIKFFIKSNFFVRKTFYYFFRYWTIISSWLYPNFFLNSMASDDLQRSIISRIKLSIMKIPVSPSKKCFIFFFFFFCNVFCFFLQYFPRQYDKYFNAYFVFQCHSFYSLIQLYLVFHYKTFLF